MRRSYWGLPFHVAKRIYRFRRRGKRCICLLPMLRTVECCTRIRMVAGLPLISAWRGLSPRRLDYSRFDFFSFCLLCADCFLKGLFDLLGVIIVKHFGFHTLFFRLRLPAFLGSFRRTWNCPFLDELCAAAILYLVFDCLHFLICNLKFGE